MRDLNDTLTFVKVVQEGSFTAAAKALQLPKTTVSRKVRDLEQRLGTRLLNRTTRRIGLTEAGTVYFERCQRIAHELDEAESAVGQLRDAPRGWLRITTPPSFGMQVIAPILPEFQRLHPEVRLDLVLSHLNLDLVAREIDVAIRMGALRDSTMTARRLGALPTRIYGAPAYLAAHGEPKHPDELWDHACLGNMTSRRPGGFGWQLTGSGEKRDYPINPMIVADDPEMLVPTLLAGGGLVMATDFAMRQYMATGAVRPVLADWVGRLVELHAVFPGGRIQPPKVRAFIDFLMQRLDLGDAGSSAASVPIAAGRNRGPAAPVHPE